MEDWKGRLLDLGRSFVFVAGACVVYGLGSVEIACMFAGAAAGMAMPTGRKPA